MQIKKHAKQYGNEVLGTGLILFGLLVGVSLLTHHAEDPSFSTVATSTEVQNAVGKIGAVFSDFVVQIFGISSHFLTLFFIVLGIKKFVSPQKPPHSLSVFSGGILLLALATSSLVSLWSHVDAPEAARIDPNIMGGMGGGMTGQLFSYFLISYFAETGTVIILISLLLIGAMLAFTFSPRAVLIHLISGFLAAGQAISKRSTSVRLKTSPKRFEPPDLGKNAETLHAPPAVTEAPPRVTEAPQQEIFDFLKDDHGDYQLPSLSLLPDPPLPMSKTTRQELIAQSQILQKKFLDYGIEGRVTQVHPGPVITMFEFEPAPGVKLNKITNLSDDLALAMRAQHVRIVAPLPGKAAVGIEIPNLNREEVSLKEILSSPSFNRLNSKLRMALGKNIFGTPVSADLSKMPHLLIAGATGAGKSVGLNTMVLSILYTATPAEVKMIMIDPKMLEFSLYDGIPHLITPVIVRPKAAAEALKKMVAEMQRRYELLSEKGVRNIEAYNKLASKTDEDDPLPYIVVLIDELADLMMVASKQVEDSIARLAQMARAAGIHLILATQRPSVDVLTGLIKANFPARIAYCVASKTDSRTILDANGAEKLLGRGDMLFSSGTGKIARVHGAYISEEEVKKVVSFIKEQSDPHYEPAFSESASPIRESSSDDRDELYEQARELVISSKQASASFIQRRMRVGYPRAARMIEMMEEDGLIGPAIGAKPREIYIREEEGDHIK
ncbi:MAG: DNA translocase FtsK 4TM domain-containing protein [Nitrospiria bacterium]